jgi:hypothetical protein
MDDDEWLAAQYLLFFDETGDEAEARRRVDALRTQRASQRRGPMPAIPPDKAPPPPFPPPQPPRRGFWEDFLAWLRR